jgi:hypothetical protein
MPTQAIVMQAPASRTGTLLAEFIDWLAGDRLAHAQIGPGSGVVEVVGKNVRAQPTGGGRFTLVGVPDGSVTLKFTLPDGATGNLPLTLPTGGGALLDLGIVAVRNGVVSYTPSHINPLFPGYIKARGQVSGLSNASVQPAPTEACELHTFVVAGVDFCFDHDTRFDPPLSVQPFTNSESPQGFSVADVIGSPYGDPSSRLFRAHRIQRNNGAPAAVNNTIQAIGPITDIGNGTVTLFGTPLITDNDPATPDVPNAHAITFTTTGAKFEPRSLEANLTKGLVVEVVTPKKSATPPVTIDADGNQVAQADRLRLVRFPDRDCLKGELITAGGEIVSVDVQTQTFGIRLPDPTNSLVFVQTVENVTRFDEPLTGFSSLTVGQVVSVIALPPKAVGGPLQALQVELAPANGEIQVRGIVSGLDENAKTFLVAGIEFCYDCDGVITEFDDFTQSKPFDNGAFVEVLGKAQLNGLSAAIRVEGKEGPGAGVCSSAQVTPQ